MTTSDDTRIPVTQVTSEPVGRIRRLNALERFFNGHRDKIAWIHLAMFGIFLVVLFVPLALPEPVENAKPWNDFTVFANFLMWGIWFPLVFLSVVFTGRSWCGLLCPMGAASEFVNNRFGLKWRTPDWIRWEGTPVVAFLIITILGQTVGVRDHKEAIAQLFGGLMLLAMIVGFFYGTRGRVWCRHMCPVGLLLGLYSRLGIVDFHPLRPKAGGDTYREKSVCPTMIDVMRKQESRHCIECFRCVNPSSPKSVAVSLRAPGSEVEAIRHHNPNTSEVWFFFIGTGAALGGFLWLILPIYQNFRQTIGEFVIEKEWYFFGESGPSWLMSVHPERREVFNWIDFTSIVSFMLLVTVVFAAAMALVNALNTWLVARTLGARQSRGQLFNILAYQYMPVAMVALLVGLGGKLFTLLTEFGVPAGVLPWLKGGLFLAGILWSLKIGYRILVNLGIEGRARWWPLAVGGAGSVLTGLSWWPAIFGV